MQHMHVNQAFRADCVQSSHLWCWRKREDEFATA